MLNKENWLIGQKCFYISHFIPEEVEILNVYEADESFAEIEIDAESEYDPSMHVDCYDLYLIFNEAFEVAKMQLFRTQTKLILAKEEYNKKDE